MLLCEPPVLLHHGEGGEGEGEGEGEVEVEVEVEAEREKDHLSQVNKHSLHV